MIAANAQNGQMLKAKELFDRMPERDVVAWTTMVTGHCQNGESKKAMAAFTAMDLEGVEANEMTFVSFLDACAATTAIAQGRALHGDLLLRPAVWSNVIVKNAVVNLYGRCGEIESAREVFEGMSSWSRTIVSWTAMATAYAHNGFGRKAVDIFRAMVLEGVAPDGVSIVGMLYACNHAGMIEDGWQCLAGIEQDYSLAPAIAHYVCAIDLLGRTGRLREAEEVIDVMPFEPDFLAWNTLLAACRVHGDFDRAERAAERVLELDPGAVGSYILLDSSRYPS
ncbi:hypothetical protein SELMODRAFT_97143 [Selaginella moellendorffii]|uniref:Pentacotripeptide-repeat region of PRORP domain-containing protein n=2 Tax=Selaginella moellendorffii TaxID=88036 RepID=D8RND8_SELML|nr:hypothetical protein SELMODRAFT_97143 [Selaginella moellendorffii]